MAAVWVEVSNGFDDAEVELNKHLLKYRVVRTRRGEFRSTKIMRCTEHKNCGVQYRLVDVALVGLCLEC
jgi:hypothetical protein